MKKHLKIFLLLSKYSIKITFQHKAGSLSFLIGKILRFGTYFLFIYYLLHNTKLLAGYNLHQTLIFFLTFNIIDTASQLLFRQVYRFRPMVVNGELDAVLIKPHHPFIRILVGGIDFLDILPIIAYIVLLFFFVLPIGNLSFMNISLYIALVINALIITTAFHIFVLALGILTTEVDHTIMIFRDINRLGVLPMDIYSEPIRSIFTFIIPIGIMITFPVKSLLGILSLNLIFVSFLVSFALFVFSMVLWNNALKKYQSWGG